MSGRRANRYEDLDPDCPVSKNERKHRHIVRRRIAIIVLSATLTLGIGVGASEVYAKTSPEAQQRVECMWHNLLSPLGIMLPANLQPDVAGSLVCIVREGAPTKTPDTETVPVPSPSVDSGSEEPPMPKLEKRYNIPVPTTVQFDNPAMISAFKRDTLPVAAYPEIQDGKESLNPPYFGEFYVVQYRTADGSVEYGTSDDSYVITAHSVNQVAVDDLGYAAGNVIQDQLLDWNDSTATWTIDPGATITVDSNQYAAESVISTSKADDGGAAYTNAINTTVPGEIIWVICDSKGPYAGHSLNYMLIITKIVEQ